MSELNESANQPAKNSEKKHVKNVNKDCRYFAVNSMFLSCHVRVSEWIHTL